MQSSRRQGGDHLERKSSREFFPKSWKHVCLPEEGPEFQQFPREERREGCLNVPLFLPCLFSTLQEAACCQGSCVVAKAMVRGGGPSRQEAESRDQASLPPSTPASLAAFSAFSCFPSSLLRGGRQRQAAGQQVVPPSSPPPPPPPSSFSLLSLHPPQN